MDVDDGAAGAVRLSGHEEPGPQAKVEPPLLIVFRVTVGGANPAGISEEGWRRGGGFCCIRPTRINSDSRSRSQPKSSQSEQSR